MGCQFYHYLLCSYQFGFCGVCQVGLYGVSIYYSWCVVSILLLWVLCGVSHLVTTCYGLCGGSCQFGMLIWVSIWFVWGVNFITTYYSSCQFGLCGVSSWFVWGVNFVIVGSVWGVNLVTTCYGLCGGLCLFGVLIWVSIWFVSIRCVNLGVNLVRVGCQFYHYLL